MDCFFTVTILLLAKELLYWKSVISNIFQRFYLIQQLILTLSLDNSTKNAISSIKTCKTVKSPALDQAGIVFPTLFSTSKLFLKQVSFKFLFSESPLLMNIQDAP